MATNDPIIWFLPTSIGAHSQTEVSGWSWPNPLRGRLYSYTSIHDEAVRMRALGAMLLWSSHMLTHCPIDKKLNKRSLTNNNFMSSYSFNWCVLGCSKACLKLLKALVYHWYKSPLGKHNGCWCLCDASRQGISIHGIDYVLWERTRHCLFRG